MKFSIDSSKIILIYCIYLCTAWNLSHAQNILNKNISIEVTSKKLNYALEVISNKGDFYFSYNSNIIKRDSLVSLNAYNKTIKQILSTLLGNNYEYKERDNYLIIHRAPIKVTLITDKAITTDNIYTVSGYVLDSETGEVISNASVYEKHLLTATLTNEKGFFKIRLKSKANTAAISVSKEFYQDTTVVIQPKYNQQINITLQPIEEDQEVVTIAPEDYFIADSAKSQSNTDSLSIVHKSNINEDSVKVEKTKIGSFFLSAKQKIQSLNLKKFFTERPFQLSLVPGLSTNGRLNSQVINTASFNILGGYSGGTNGLEIGGFFNINKKHVSYLQAATIFNIVGGNVTGIQIAGASNTVLGNVIGIQTTIGNNWVRGNFTGLQLAGFSNVSNKEVRGGQIALFNYAKKLKGVQFGLINVCDTSNGYSFGIINIVFKGYHKLSVYTNETMDVNFAFKTGNSKLYSILLGGINTKPNEKAYSFGYGIGHEFKLGNVLSLNPEVSSQLLYLGTWNYTNFLSNISMNFNIKLNKYISLFGGPSYILYYSDQPSPVTGYKFIFPESRYQKQWFGWNAGINFF